MEAVLVDGLGRVRNVTAHTCPQCDGQGIKPRSRGRGRPRSDEPRAWQFCDNCQGRGWVSQRGGGRPTVAGVSHAERYRRRKERGREFFRRWRDGESMPTIGASCTPPITRERVRQLVYEFTPMWEIRLVYQLHAARARLREFERRTTVAYRIECWVCGTTFDATGATSTEFPACERHGGRSSLGMGWMDICNVRGRRERRRNAPSARPVISQPGDYRVNTGQRWTVPGSRMHVEVSEAVRDNWPVVALLDPQIVEQHRKLLGLPDGVRGALALSRLYLHK